MRIRLHILLYFLFSAFGCFSQTREVDSLMVILKTSREDTNKVNLLNDLAREYVSFNIDSSFLLSAQALSISEKQNWKKGEANSCIWLGWCKYLQNDYSKALEYDFRALRKGEEINNKRIISSALGSIANVYLAQNNYAQAMDHYSKALKIAQELNNKAGVAIQLGNMGNVYLNQANYSDAIDCYFKALKIGEELGDKNRIEIQLNNIGIVYDEQKNYPVALAYYSKALKMAEEKGNKDGIASKLGNIGGIYMNQADYSKALEYFFRALKMEEALGNKNNCATWLGNIGIVYFEQGKFDLGLDYYFRALKIAEELEDKNGMAIHLVNIGSLYLKTGKFVQAEKYLMEALKISTEISALNLVQENHLLLSDLYDTIDRSKLAYEHYRKHIVYRDSLQNEENIKKQTRTEMQYEFDKKQTADSIKNVEQAKQENIRHEQEIKQQRTYTYGGTIGCILMLIVAGISFRAFKQKQKVNEIIAFQKEFVEEKQKEILDSIQYARRIQQSLLPSEMSIQKNLTRLKKQ